MTHDNRYPHRNCIRLGKKLEVVSRDDGGNPGDAVRVADELAIGQIGSSQ